MKKMAFIVLVVLVSAVLFAQIGAGVKLYGESYGLLVQLRGGNTAVELSGTYGSSSLDEEEAKAYGIFLSGKYYLPLNDFFELYAAAGIVYLGGSVEGTSINMLGTDSALGIELGLGSIPVKFFLSLDAVQLMVLGYDVTIPGLSYQLGFRYDF